MTCSYNFAGSNDFWPPSGSSRRGHVYPWRVESSLRRHKADGGEMIF